MENKKAFITGVTGQDGSYLTELLITKGYEVHGLVRRSSTYNNTERLAHIIQNPGMARRFIMHDGDLTDPSCLARLIDDISPTEVYNLAAQSHVGLSFDVPEYTASVDALGALQLLDVIRKSGAKVKFYQASSSEMFGDVTQVPQDENTPFRPRSPYGVAKLFGHWMTVNYRESYGVFACSGILFNHESPRRGDNFVTRKITKGVAEILDGKREKIYLGNLDAKRDWGYAPEYVDAMWRMLQQESPDDYVVATGETHSVREFVEEAFRIAGIRDWEKFIAIDKAYWRPSEVNVLCGNASKAKEKLGWEPKVKFKELVKIMVTADCEKAGVKIRTES